MAYNVKSYTDVEQARYLARILSPKNADSTTTTYP